MKTQTPTDEAEGARRARMKPTINGSTYVKPQLLEWKKTQFDKVWLKVLYEDKEKGESTVLITLEPGATLPYHFVNKTTGYSTDS